MTTVKKIKPFHTDERGEMSYLLDEKVKITNALLISSKKASIRANHYHKTDSHYSYLLKGKIKYITQDIKQKGKKKITIIKAGEMFYTPPNLIHAMVFLEDSLFLALTTESRDQKKYEKDLVRVKIA